MKPLRDFLEYVSPFVKLHWLDIVMPTLILTAILIFLIRKYRSIKTIRRRELRKTDVEKVSRLPQNQTSKDISRRKTRAQTSTFIVFHPTKASSKKFPIAPYNKKSKVLGNIYYEF